MLKADFSTKDYCVAVIEREIWSALADSARELEEA
jgi:hypothetical protein